MSKMERLAFTKVDPLTQFGSSTILSAQAEIYGHANIEVIYNGEPDLIEDYLHCAYPGVKIEVKKRTDQSVDNIDADYLLGFDLSKTEGYESALKEKFGEVGFDFSKPNEAIYFVNGRVIKYFKDPQIIKKRVIRAKALGSLVPPIEVVGQNHYSYSLVPGETLYTSLQPGMTEQFLNWCMTNLWRDNNLLHLELEKFPQACMDFYRTKTFERVTKYWENADHSDASNIVNGTATPTLSHLLSLIDWEELAVGRPTLYHGDLQFDNVILSDSGNFALLDWRQDFSGLIETGDMYYDLAKLYGGIILPYSSIKRNQFSYMQEDGDVTLGVESAENLSCAETEFWKFIDDNNLDKQRIRLLTALIFINMAPLHTPPFNKFLHHLGKLKLTQYFSNSD